MLLVWSALVAASMLALAQPPQAVGQNAPPNPAQAINLVRPDYELGPNDQILISLPELEEINQRPFRIDADGFINLPLSGGLGLRVCWFGDWKRRSPRGLAISRAIRM